MTNYNPEKLRDAYMNLERGDSRLRAIGEACAAAERANDFPWVMQFHYEYIHESVFSGDRYRALVDFPRYLALMDEHPEEKAKYAHDRLWTFKWIVEATKEFYQIPLEQVLAWFSEFRRECLRQGYSLRSFYQKRAKFYSFIDRSKLLLNYQESLNAPRDSLSDGKACDLDTMVEWELEFGHYDRAMMYAEKIFRKRMHSEEVPAGTYDSLMRYHIRQGEMEQAEKYAVLLRPYCEGQRFRLEQIANLFDFYSRTDVPEGLRFYKNQRGLKEGSKNPYLCFWFDWGAGKLMRAAWEQGLVWENFFSPDEQDGSFEKAAESCTQSAQNLAAQFDARNGSDYFAKQCRK